MKTFDEKPNDKKKRNLTKKLPMVLDGKSVFDGMLTPEEANKFGATSKKNYRLFNNGKEPGHRLPNMLLLSVARGEQTKAASILNTCPHLLSHRGNVTNYSGLTFKNITAFQYALWAMDTHMCHMIIRAIPDGIEGEVLRAELIRQYEELEAHGVTYELEGQTMTEQHFDFSRLINALQVYVDNFDDWYNSGPTNWEAIKHHWCKVVGLAQRYVPAHVAQQYCHPTHSFFTAPQLDEPTLKRSLTFYNYITDREMKWWPGVTSSSLVLGEDFGIFRGKRRRRQGGVKWSGVGAAMLDLAAVTTMCRVSTSDLKQTLEILARERAPEHQPQRVVS